MNCNCAAAGFCATYQREMSPRQHRICRGEILTPEKCEAFRANWQMLRDGGLSPSEQTRPSGPGTELKSLLSQLGATPTASCGCDEKTHQMNAWGVAGCREHREEIIGWLKKSYAATNWPRVIRSAGAALFSGLAVSLAIAYARGGVEGVLGFLLDEAIRRAEANAAKVTADRDRSSWSDRPGGGFAPPR
jgi:hypothetical protein